MTKEPTLSAIVPRGQGKQTAVAALGWCLPPNFWGRGLTVTGLGFRVYGACKVRRTVIELGL